MTGIIRINYDEEGDYLTFFIGDSKSNYGQDIEDGVTVFKDQDTDEVIGVGILGFRKKSKNLNDIIVNIPFKIDFSNISI